eukprot:13825326-Alexandrium_andersonii.AAC.1
MPELCNHMPELCNPMAELALVPAWPHRCLVALVPAAVGCSNGAMGTGAGSARAGRHGAGCTRARST